MKKNLAVLTFLGLFLSHFSWATSVYVSPTGGNGLAEDKESVRELIKLSVSQTEGFTVSENVNQADLNLQSKVLRLGDSVILNLSKLDKSGKILFAEKMKAATISDLDRVSSRLVSAVLMEKKIQDTADVTNITQTEQTEHNRRIEATRQWIVGLGPGWSSKLRSKGGGFTFTLGYLWGLDPDFAVNLSWVTHSGRGDSDDSTFNDISLGMEYFFSSEKVSPFLGARVGWASAKPDGNCLFSAFGCDSSKASGWALTVSGGVKFFRTSSVNVGVLSNYHMVFDRVNLGRPALLNVLLAVYY